MAKPKATYEQMRLFGDAELKTSRHDEIMLWLDRRVREDCDLLADILGDPPTWGKPEVVVDWDIYNYIRDGDPTLSAVNEAALDIAEPPPEKPKPKCGDVVWEYPVRAETGRRIVGFTDMLAHVHLPHLRLAVEVETDRSHWRSRLGRRDRGDESAEPPTTIERLLKASVHAKVAFRVANQELVVAGDKNGIDQEDREWIDANKPEIVTALGAKVASGSTVYSITGTSWGVSWPEWLVYFEVKTEIGSVGELVRQLQYYRAFVRNKLVVVAPPHETAARVLQTQGFGFVEFNGD